MSDGAQQKGKPAHIGTLVFRMASAADLDALADLRWRLSTDDAPLADAEARERFIAAFRSALPPIDVQRGPVHFVAAQTSTLIAALSIILVPKIPHPNDLHGRWGYLTNVYTLPEYRNHGVGSRLLALAQSWAQQQRLELLIVWPSDQSYPFYQRAGFRREADPLVFKSVVED